MIGAHGRRSGRGRWMSFRHGTRVRLRICGQRPHPAPPGSRRARIPRTSARRSRRRTQAPAWHCRAVVGVGDEDHAQSVQPCTQPWELHVEAAHPWHAAGFGVPPGEQYGGCAEDGPGDDSGPVLTLTDAGHGQGEPQEDAGQNGPGEQNRFGRRLRRAGLQSYLRSGAVDQPMRAPRSAATRRDAASSSVRPLLMRSRMSRGSNRAFHR